RQDRRTMSAGCQRSRPAGSQPEYWSWFIPARATYQHLHQLGGKRKGEHGPQHQRGQNRQALLGKHIGVQHQPGTSRYVEQSEMAEDMSAVSHQLFLDATADNQEQEQAHHAEYRSRNRHATGALEQFAEKLEQEQERQGAQHGDLL